MPIMSISQQCQKGDGTDNADSIFTTPHAVGLLDGATDIVNTKINGVSSAAWFSKAVADHLMVCFQSPKHEHTTRDILQQVLDDIWVDQFSEMRPEYVTQPSSTLTLVRDMGKAIELTALGDSRIIFKTSDNKLHVFGKSNVEFYDCLLIEKLKALQSKHPKWKFSELKERLKGLIAKNRTLMNEPEGYGILTPDAAGLPFLQSMTINKCKIQNARLLLASDGWLRISELFQFLSYEELLYLSPKELVDALQSLREVEISDSEAKMFPRLKIHDDASCLVVDIS